METMLRGTILNYLTTHNTLSLATVSDEGLPHAATVFYVNIDLDLYFLSNSTSRHGINFSHNDRVSATIDEDYAHWRLIKGLQLEGTVRPVGGIWDKGRLALAFVEKFPDVVDFFPAPPMELTKKMRDKVERVQFYRLTPSRICFTDNALGFGHREQLILPPQPQENASGSE